LDALPGVIIAYSNFDQDKAAKYEQRLPSILGQKDIDVDKLENSIQINLKVKKKWCFDQRKKKKKKKKILPKDLSKPIDPERWIPLKQRSHFKKKSNRKNKMDKGSQGVTVGRSIQLEKGKTTNDKVNEKPSTSPPNSPPTERKEEVKEQKDSKQAAQNAKKKTKRKRHWRINYQ